jgi:hypothetical protein
MKPDLSNIDFLTEYEKIEKMKDYQEYIFLRSARFVFLTVVFSFVLLTWTAYGCSRDIDLLTASMKSKFLLLEKEAAKNGISIKPICTYRSSEEQLQLYSIGRTKPGNKVTWVKHSKHSDGTAVDIAVYHGKKISWEPGEYRTVGNLAKNLNLTWGGNWKQQDLGHFELKEPK